MHTVGSIGRLLVPLLLASCSFQPLVPYTTDIPPMIMTPAIYAGIDDQRGRFREIFCTVNAYRGPDLPDHRSCEEALVRLGEEPAPTGRLVYIGRARSDLRVVAVPGFSHSCLEKWIEPPTRLLSHLEAIGYETVRIPVAPFSSSALNGRHIRDAVMEMPDSGKNVVLLGYSKGVPDVLEALVDWPEMHERVAAVVSLAGAVGGSMLAEDPPEWLLKLLQAVGGPGCDPGDGGGLESLRTSTRRRWLAEHQLPESIRYYSVVALPDQEHLSKSLSSSYKKLSQVDPRNDGQLLFFDQVIPAGALLGYVNADHWAVAVGMARSHKFLASIFVDRNEFPREVLLESIIRHLEEQMLMSESS